MKPNSLSFSRILNIIRNRTEPEYARSFADIYWRALLSIAVLTIVGGCGFGIFLFFDVLVAVSPDTMNHHGGINATKTIDRVKMQEILDGFATRISGVQGLQTLPPTTLSDPSK